tara:strand:- start:3512 stop:4057 length:546 start_codon:yes stop_codon:yes gene_type:complete
MQLDDQIKSLSKKLDKIAKVETIKAHISAVNKVAAQSKTAIASISAAETKIKVSKLKKRIFVKRASFSKPSARVYFYSRPVDALDASNSRVAKGWKVAGTFRQRSFLARMPNQSRHHIFQRDGNGPVRTAGGKKRERIKMITVEAADSLNRVGPAVTELKMMKDYHRLLKSELSARLKGYV